MRANEHIRKAMKEHKVTLWQTAAALGVCDMTLSRWLRLPLSPEKEVQVMTAIEIAAKEA